MFRIGQGFDGHQLQQHLPLIIGGVTIPSDWGSAGHSDGDVLYHALTDALLGALSLGDIGTYFPSADDKWKDADSRIFLEHACSQIEHQGFKVVNVDSTVILQSPRLRPFILPMRRNIAEILHLDPENVSVKASTTDHLGFTGRKEGIAALAVVLLEKSTPAE